MCPICQTDGHREERGRRKEGEKEKGGLGGGVRVKQKVKPSYWHDLTLSDTALPCSCHGEADKVGSRIS